MFHRITNPIWVDLDLTVVKCRSAIFCWDTWINGWVREQDDGRTKIWINKKSPRADGTPCTTMDLHAKAIAHSLFITFRTPGRKVNAIAEGHGSGVSAISHFCNKISQKGEQRLSNLVTALRIHTFKTALSFTLSLLIIVLGWWKVVPLSPRVAV